MDEIDLNIKNILLNQLLKLHSHIQNLILTKQIYKAQSPIKYPFCTYIKDTDISELCLHLNAHKLTPVKCTKLAHKLQCSLCC